MLAQPNQFVDVLVVVVVVVVDAAADEADDVDSLALDLDLLDAPEPLLAPKLLDAAEIEFVESQELRPLPPDR